MILRDVPRNAGRAAWLAALAALAALAVMFWPMAGSAQDRDQRWTATVHFENDLFANTDGRYTNGVKLTLVSPDLTSAFRDRKELPQWARGLVARFPFREDDHLARTFALSVGQNIYTPVDTDSRALIPGDRPYAGWLYLAATFQERDADRQDTVDVQIGVVGPAALGEQAQNYIHRLRSIKEAQGWNNQLRNEPGVVLAFERAWRAGRVGSSTGLGGDVITSLGGAIGNVATYAGGGAQVRLGWNLPPDFGYSVIRPGGATQANSLRDATERGSAEAERRASLRRKGFSVHLFAGASGRAIGRDIFLDGNTLRDSHDVDGRRLVGDLLAGATVGYGGARLSFARVLRTREFDGQPDDHRFGSLTFTYAF